MDATTIEVDSDTQSINSDYESVVSDTTSTRSSIFEYVYENGHTYHAYRAGQYLLPNDEKEQDRLDLQHHIFRLVLGGDITISKLKDPQRILDVGTGTGIWAIDAGDLFPSAEVIGVDLSPIQPNWTPPNVKFEIDDVTLPWTYELNSFDFIHIRTLGGSIKDWVGFLVQVYKHLKPGGLIEVSEIRTHFHCDDGSLGKDSNCVKWEETFHEIAKGIGLEFDQMPKMSGWVKEAGFTDIQEVEKLIPIGTWAKDKRLKEIGMYYLVHLLIGMEHYSIALFTRNGWLAEEVQVLLAKVRNELLSNKFHTYTKAVFVTARKPDTR
ncbi:hypothetical protein, variant [Verruconis gallopava]|uniref:Methyltransferase domain-containing protein n=1 Tax=Verruconis gallopava TaxID=253628 RepID=A0A0D1XPF6_9PEZI|nr:uncharacterized protein PV09_04708 [Verruconis gallopava]XP_016214311.1 hypothetical protein, variant [Verruconis gallopava]KIW04441.1 hypothetical protein PV09_04708 [Verruconis gallopava]KIW04442.1 hypothetical protein, variant [Verruconis gallopava]